MFWDGNVRLDKHSPHSSREGWDFVECCGELVEGDTEIQTLDVEVIKRQPDAVFNRFSGGVLKSNVTLPVLNSAMISLLFKRLKPKGFSELLIKVDFKGWNVLIACNYIYFYRFQFVIG